MRRRGRGKSGIGCVCVRKFYPYFGQTAFCPCILRLQNVITHDIIINNSSSDNFSSALSYALERLNTPNLTLKEEQRKSAVYQGNSVFVHGYRQDWARSFATKFSHSWSSTRKGDVVAHSAIASHDHLFYV